MTVGEFKDLLKGWPDDCEIQFGGTPDLEFYRFERRGENLVQLEFNQNVWKDEAGEWHVDGL
jgi:hypothetical protein